jgi:hypothetical protein
MKFRRLTLAFNPMYASLDWVELFGWCPLNPPGNHVISRDPSYRHMVVGTRSEIVWKVPPPPNEGLN